MKKSLFFLILLFSITSFCSCSGFDRTMSGTTLPLTTVDDTILNEENGIDKIDDLIIKAYNLTDFKCYRIMVDTCDCEKHESKITFYGTYDNNGNASEWVNSYSISYDEFKKLYDKDSNFTIYNTKTEDSIYNKTEVSISDEQLSLTIEILIDTIQNP